MAKGLPIAFLVLAALLAGCGSKEPQYDQRIASGPDAPAIPPEPVITGTGHGTLVGIVTDPFHRPVFQALVALAGTDRFAETDRNGTFAIEDLEEGTYGAVASHARFAEAQGTVLIKADTETSAWFELGPLPPQPPRHHTITWNGTLTVTGTPIIGFAPSCVGCSKPFQAEKGLASMILEMSMPLGGPVPVRPFPDPLDLDNQTIQWEIDTRTCCDTTWYGWGPNPLWARLDDHPSGNFTVTLYPSAYPLPETQRRFTAHLTLFYGAPAPENWSYLSGSR